MEIKLGHIETLFIFLAGIGGTMFLFTWRGAEIYAVIYFVMVLYVSWNTYKHGPTILEDKTIQIGGSKHEA